MNAIIVVLRTTYATYRNSFKAHVFRSSKCVQQALNLLRTWNTSRDIFVILWTKVRRPLPKNVWEKVKKLKLYWKWLQIVIFTFGIIQIATIFFKVSSLTRNTLFQPFDPFFFNRSAKFGLGYVSQIFLDFVNNLFITFEELAPKVMLQGLNNQKSHSARSRLYAGCTITSMLCHSSHSGTKWATCGQTLLWWSMYHPISSDHFHQMCLNNFSNMDTQYSLVFVPYSSTHLCDSHRYMVCLWLSCLLPVTATCIW